MKEALRANIWKLNFGAFLMETYFFVAVFIPIMTHSGLTIQEALWIEGIYAITLASLEIPSGYFADVYGRKPSLVIGAIFGIIGLSIFPFAHGFWAFALGRVVIGVGRSFASGAREALLYDSLVELNEEEKYQEHYGQITFKLRIAAALAGIIGGLSAQLWIRLPLILGLLPALIWLPFPFTLTEPKRKTMQLEHWQHFKHIFKDTFIKQRDLGLLVLYTGLLGTFMYLAYWIIQSYMDIHELPLLFFGIFISAQNILGAIAGKYNKQLSGYFSVKQTLLLIPLAVSSILVIIALLNTAFAAAFILVVGFLWGFSGPYTSTLLQERVSSDRRATVLSTVSMMHRGCFFVLGPLMGWITDIYSIGAALLLTALLYMLSTGLSLAALKSKL